MKYSGPKQIQLDAMSEHRQQCR